ncbi:type II toxin-antitoxin system VapC family toxin [Phenylobacterium sp.]|jgi:ribonuclease VapC|uniref:type II toxin-antitoxin system VapC family toxin n=1 Tax=Phenylobacterium sp. TaxID=1871053 RepID=UPI0037C7E5D3
MIFVDASAICAILLGEPEMEAFTARIDADPEPITSALAVYETVLAVARAAGGSVAEAQRDVNRFLGEARIRVVMVSDQEGATALGAFDRYGKGRHPARLNMGDCFAYACAKTHGIPLLFKGDDFSQTDIAIA